MTQPMNIPSEAVIKSIFTLSFYTGMHNYLRCRQSVAKIARILDPLPPPKKIGILSFG